MILRSQYEVCITSFHAWSVRDAHIKDWEDHKRRLVYNVTDPDLEDLENRFSPEYISGQNLSLS